jgi:flagellar hook-associated protein 3 FlgL
MRADPFYQSGLSTPLDAITLRQDQLTSELSSGLAVSAPSDDPLAASQGVALSSAISRDDAYIASASTLEGRLQTADSVLGSVVSQLTSAISTATGGINSTLSAANLQAVGTTLSSIRAQVVSLANTSYAGSYLFSGTEGSTQPYTVDSSGNATYSGDANSTYTQTPGGQKIATGVPGSAIFSASGADVLSALNNLIADFSSGTVSTSAQDDLASLTAGLKNVSTQRAVLDGSLSTLQQTSTYASTDKTNLAATQSSLVSADTAEIATELSSTQTQSEALMSVMSSLGSKSLFDFMQ